MTDLGRGSFSLPERTGDLLLARLDEVLQRRALASAREHLKPACRHDLEIVQAADL